MNYVFVHHKGKRTSRSHSEKQKQIWTVASIFFIHFTLWFRVFFYLFSRFLVFVFVYLSICLFVCLLVLISFSVFSSLSSHFNICFVTLSRFLCLFVLLCYFFYHSTVILLPVFDCNIYCLFFLSMVSFLETLLIKSSKRIVQLLRL